MEDPVHQAGKKKPAFASFWERQRKDSTSDPSSATPTESAAHSTSSSTASHSATSRIDVFERSASASPSKQRSTSSQHAGPSSGPALSGVQRLIQQYSQSNAASAPSSSSVSLNRSLSGSSRRSNGASPQSNRIASSSQQLASADSAFGIASAPADRSPTSKLSVQSGASSLSRHSSLSAATPRKPSIDSHVVPPATIPPATTQLGVPTDAVARDASSPSHQSSTPTSASRDKSRLAEPTKESDVERAKRRRRLLQEQLRKRNNKRRSAGAIEVDESPEGSSDEADSLTIHTVESSIANSEAAKSAILESLSRGSSGSGDLQTQIATSSTPMTQTAAVTAPLASNQQRTMTSRSPTFQDTRPWLEFSPLLPDSELLESPEKTSAPSLAMLHHPSASSDLSASGSQSSVTTDPTMAESARPSPSRSNSASTPANDSPVSPTGLGFSIPLAYPSTASYLSINPSSPSYSQSPSTRSFRTTKLPPPRPTPSAPLPPPPPSVASSIASSTSAHTLTGPPRSVRTTSMRTNPAPPLPHSNEADVFGAPSSHSRTLSLEQELASLDQEYHRLTVDVAPPQSTSAHARDSVTAPASSLLTVPMIRQRSNSLQRQDREAQEAASRPAKVTSSNSPPATHAAPSSSSQSVSTSSRSLSKGRPRGFTVGAVPGPSSPLRGGVSSQAPVKTRPRSLLSNEIFPLDLAEPRFSSKAGRDGNDNARHAYSMDIDRRTSSLGLTTSSGVVNERDGGGSGSSERLAPDSADRRPSVGGRSRSGSSASLLQQVNSQPKSHASFVIAVVGHTRSGKSTVIKKGLRQFGLSKPHVLSEKVTSHSTVCVVDQEQRTIEVLEIDASVLLNGPSKRFAWPKFLPHIDAVTLCYDASEIASFRGMSELLENFAVANLSTVMLACKSEVFPKAVDPYYASDMACIYNVGLAECTVQSEEGKKRMRDCFSYLVKEVAKARTGRSRRGPANTVPPLSSARSQSPGSAANQAVHPTRSASAYSQASSQGSHPPASEASEAMSASSDMLPSPAAPIDPSRARGYSSASSSALGRRGAAGSDASVDDAFAAFALRHPAQATSNQDIVSDPSAAAAMHARTVNAATEAVRDTHVSPRKMSSATVVSALSGISDVPSFQSEEDPAGAAAAMQDSVHRSQLARTASQSAARSSGGYVPIEELWDKLFHAAISRTDERFVTMFMVFYRGFATPLDLLDQMVMRFDTLTAEDVADGLVHRFALIRLTNMLGDWVLDYPGDLSHPDTHARLVRYHGQLLHHPDTVHTAAQIQGAVEATANAVDLDALWSNAVNSDQTRHKNSIVAAMAGAGVGAEDDVSAEGITASGSNNSTSGLNAGSGNTSHDFDHGPNNEDADAHERTGSESSLPLRTELGAGNRSRSASDLTTSSTEGNPSPAATTSSGGASSFYKDTKHPSSSATHPNSSATSLTTSYLSGVAETVGALPSTVPNPTRSLDQKSTLRSISNTLMEIDDEIIATELTRLEWGYFTAIQPRDLLRHILVPHDKRDGPVARSISHFNYISNWVCSMILAQGKTKHRARMLEKFFNIASILRHDNNYGSLNSVLGGLSKTAVHRLKHTRELLKGKSVNKAYASLVRLMSNERSSAAYRLALENSDGPTIPYVGVHLQDILSISDGNPSKRGAEIHWRKFSLMDEAVMAVARCQMYDRYIKPNPAVERLITDVPVMDDEALYERSLIVEPRSGGGGTGGGLAGTGSKIKDLKTFLSSQSYSSSSYHA